MRHSPLIQAILPIRSVVVTLRWLYNSQPGFYHHIGLHAWVRFLAGSPSNFSDYMMVEPLENGHSHYQADEFYRFRLIALSGGEGILANLLEALQSLPQSVPLKARDRGPFGDNLVIESISDSFTHTPVEHLGDVSLYDENDLTMETILWSRSSVFKVAFHTPARLVRLKTERDEDVKGSERYCRDKADITWEMFSKRLTDTLINLYQQRTNERLQRGEWPDAFVHHRLAFWVDNQYQSQQQKSKKDASGLLAHLQIEIPDDFPADLLALIVLGQYTGIGQHRSFGMGRYQLQDAYGMVSVPRPQAAQTLLDRCFSKNALHQACLDMYPRRSDFDRDASDQDHQASIDSHLMALQKSQQKILTGQYQAGVLQPVEIEKPDGGTRHLSVPNWHERTLQKAVTTTLGQILDQLWMKHSYGYRKGLSRLHARDQINQYIKQGYHWVLESDIESFFDSVNWQNLEQRLKLLLPNEPLVDLLMQWVSADKRDQQDNVISRHQGLPQGAPISPILANLLLDDLDQDMLAKGHQIVRYADDFVMLFKSQEAAEAALADIHLSLQEHDLAINPDKTRIVESSQGFKYLGYVFIDGYAIESKREKVTSPTVPPTNKPSADNLLSEVPPISESGQIGERENLGLLLTIAGDIAMLSSEKNRLIVEQYDERQSYPWHTLSAVMLIGPHHITTPALRSAMKANVPIHFANQFGQYQGVSASGQPSELGADFWLQQSLHMQQPTHALEISQALITGRLAGIKAVIQRRETNAPELDALIRLSKQIQRAENLDQLRGFEGQASKQLWAFFKRYLEPEWQFTGRNRRPPKDPVNALLSLGYSFLYGLVDSLNRAVGLYPWQAALHQKHGYHHTLASDLMEPFRYLVERVVLTLINKGQVKLDDFADTEQGCQMSSEARKTLLHELLVQLTYTSKQQDSLLNQIRNQAYRLAISCKTQQTFHAWSPKK